VERSRSEPLVFIVHLGKRCATISKREFFEQHSDAIGALTRCRADAPDSSSDPGSDFELEQLHELRLGFKLERPG
jgi:hypothetical protein